MKLILKEHAKDKTMVELWDENNRDLYAVIHEDLFLGEDMRAHLHEEGVIVCNIEMVKE